MKVRFEAVVQRSSQKAGFSLIELLIIMAVIGILVIVAIPFFQTASMRAKMAKVHTDMVQIAIALDSYYLEHSSYPPTFKGAFYRDITIEKVYNLTTPITFLTTIPKQPWLGKLTRLVNKPDNSFLPDYAPQSNYIVSTACHAFYPNHLVSGILNGLDKPCWVISCSGPNGGGVNRFPHTWFSPTNGIYSIGSFWMDSTGTSTF